MYKYIYTSTSRIGVEPTTPLFEGCIIYSLDQDSIVMDMSTDIYTHITDSKILQYQFYTHDINEY